MIKVTYDTFIDKMKKPEVTTINIFEGRMFVKYNTPNKAEYVVNKMRQDGRRGVLFSRGLMIQNFIGKNEEEILDIVKKDIDNGVYIAEQKTKKKPIIKNLNIDKIKR